MTPLREFRQVIGMITAAAAIAALLLWPISYISYDRVNIPLHVVHHVVVGWGRGDIIAQVVIGNGLYMDSIIGVTTTGQVPPSAAAEEIRVG